VEVLPDLGEEVKEGQEEGVEGVEPAVEAAWGGTWVKRFRSLARARALLCLPPSSMAASMARVRMTLEGTLVCGSSLWPIAWRASSMMQKAAMVRESGRVKKYV
jgi:hypothetical protein